MVYSKDHGVLAAKTLPYTPSVGDVYTQDALAIMDAVMEIGCETADGYDVEAVALVGAWHSILRCDQNMEPIGKAYTWANLDAKNIAARLRKDRSFTTHVYESTGCMVHALYPMLKLFYFRENDLLPDNCLLTEIGSYLFFKLTGERLSTDSLWSGSCFYSYNEKHIDSLILDRLGLKRDQFGIPATHEDVRPLLPKWAKRLGIRPGIPVLPAMPDGGMNQVGSGALKPGLMTLSVGTSAALRVSSDLPRVSPGRETWCYRAPDTYLCGAAVQGGTSCVDWFVRDVMDNRLSYTELNDIVEPSEIAPVFLPFLFGERCPGWRDDRQGGFYRLTGRHSYRDLYYAVLEGIIMNIAQCYRALRNLVGEPAEVHVSGGILKSPAWMQMLCDLLGRELYASQIDQASLLGGAVLALNAVGQWPDITDVPSQAVLVKPNPESQVFYDRRTTMYLEEYDKELQQNGLSGDR